MKVIHLIDDAAEIRLTFGMVLRDQGYRVIESSSGEEGLELARRQMPDLILTDINMPGGDGETLLNKIRADPELCSKQVVLMTGRPDLVSPRRGMEQGADDFLVKPVSREALLACLDARMKRADIPWRVEDRAVDKLRTTMTRQLPHEFFTPLAGILGLSEILSGDLSSFAPGEIQELTRDIHKSAQRLHRTLRNYLLMLQPPAASSARHSLPAPLAFPSVRKSLQAGVDFALARHDRADDLLTEWSSLPLVVAAADLEIIVEELLDNAFKFSRRGTPVTARLDAAGSLTVTDAGRGMTPEEIKAVGAFRQFDRDKHEQQGLGLGLGLVQELALRSGAIIEIASLETGICATVKFQT